MLNETMKNVEIPVVPELAERVRVCSSMLRAAQLVHSDIFGPSGNFGAEIDAVFVACAVLIGHAERRPMTAHKISLYLGMPRPTVLRKLKLLESLNVVQRIGTQYFVTAERMESDKKVLASLLALSSGNVD